MPRIIRPLLVLPLLALASACGVSDRAVAPSIAITVVPEASPS
jgi:hypothetical protein